MNLRGRGSRRALFLVQLLATTALMVVVGALLSRALLNLLQVHRLALEHADRIAVIDTLSERLRNDLRAAERVEAGGDALTLHTRGPAGPVRLEYRLAPDGVSRAAAVPGEAPAATEYRARRLRFEWQFAAAPRGGLLELRFVELPPAHRRLPDRVYASVFWLPETAEVRP